MTPESAVLAERPRPGSLSRHTFYIGGRWREPLSAGSLEVTDSGTEELLGTVPAGGQADVDVAVIAAARALPPWAQAAPADRAAVLRRTAEVLSERSAALATMIAAEVGTPLRVARQLQVALPIRILESFAELAETHQLEEVIGNSLVVKDAVGVVAAITPWNYPLHVAISKVAAALAAGCTVVLKPSELAPFALYELAEAFHSAGLPPGVFNLVVGVGADAGSALVAQPLVDMVSFTGSTTAGRRVGAAASRAVKRVTLELGGKSASVVLPGGPLERAVPTSVNNAFLNSGQTCTAWSRLLVARSQQEEALELVRLQLERLPLGDAFEPASRLGPLVSAAQLERVRGYIEQGFKEGARLVCGGVEPVAGRPKGYYVQPTVFADVTPDMLIAREEIFGPVLSVMPYVDESEALEIANSTDYGLAGAVWAAEDEPAVRFARAMRAGQVDVNGGRYNPLAPFGGLGLSGVGRELGRYGLEECLEIRSLQLPATTG